MEDLVNTKASRAAKWIVKQGQGQIKFRRVGGQWLASAGTFNEEGSTRDIAIINLARSMGMYKSKTEWSWTTPMPGEAIGTVVRTVRHSADGVLLIERVLHIMPTDIIDYGTGIVSPGHVCEIGYRMTGQDSWTLVAKGVLESKNLVSAKKYAIKMAAKLWRFMGFSQGKDHSWPS